MKFSILLSLSVAAVGTLAVLPKQHASRRIQRRDFDYPFAGASLQGVGGSMRAVLLQQMLCGAAFIVPPVNTTGLLKGSAEASSAVAVGVGCYNLAGGISVNISGNAAVTYRAWTAWGSTDTIVYDPNDFAFTSGDQIQIGVESDTYMTSATMTMTNVRTKTVFTKSFSVDPKNYAYASELQSLQLAQWIVTTSPTYTTDVETLMPFGTIELTGATVSSFPAADLSTVETGPLVPSFAYMATPDAQDNDILASASFDAKTQTVTVAFNATGYGNLYKLGPAPWPQ